MKTTNQIVIALGASAGGLEALKTFFTHTPDDCPFTFIIVQHLSPDYKSLMSELLSKHTHIPIVEISDNCLLESNTIYLIPPKSNLILENGICKLLDKPVGHGLNLPIDLLFHSAAAHYTRKFIGVVLSGTGSDGTKGIQSVKKFGGLTVAQQPLQAKFDGMPKSAIQTGYIDFVLPVEEMLTEIANYTVTTLLSPNLSSEVSIEDSMFTDIIEVIKRSTDIDFEYYKKPTLVRRIYKRLQALQFKHIQEYYQYLIENPYEIHILYEEILIGVTKFFRDEEAWHILESKIVPAIVTEKKDNETIKIWDVGCSTGEETYSLAMLFSDEIKKQGKSLNLKIFGTDISKNHIDIASRGIYGPQIANDISKERLSTYFTATTKGFKVKESLRNLIIFSNHNIIKDPPFKDIDVAVCRNLLIYLQNAIQQNAIHVLHYSLKENGVLFLGSSENLGNLRQNFEVISRKWKLFKNMKTSKRLSTEILKSTSDRNIKTYTPPMQQKKPLVKEEQHQQVSNIIGEAVLEQFGAASVHIDEYYSILDAKGELRKYIQFPERGFTTNLLEMLPEMLKIPVTTSVNKARRGAEKYVYERVQYQIKEEELLVSLFIKPIEEDTITTYIITFVDVEPADASVSEVASISESAAKRIIDLEEELIETKDRLKTSLKETEISNEELQAANEELLASNEELQSTNEELQSVNEELHTVNTENLQKVDDLASLNDDINNLLNSTNIGTMFLDKELNIRKYTPAIKEHFNLLPQDIGRYIGNFIANFNNEHDFIVTNAQKVLKTGKVFERNIVSKNGDHFIKRISPFLSGKNTVDGVVVSFIDVEKMYQSQLSLRRSEEKFKSFYDDDPVMHASVNLDNGIIVECNKLFVKRMEYASKKEIIGKKIIEFYPDDAKVQAVELMDELRNKKFLRNQEVTYITKNKKRIDTILNTNVVEDTRTNTLLTRSTLLDVTELKEVQMELRKEKENLIAANKELEQFVSICSHDLQEPLGTIRFGSELVIKKFSDQLDPKGKEYLNYIFDAAGRLSNQIRALLEYSRLGKSKEKVLVNTKETVEVVLYDLNRRIKECNAVVHVGQLPKIMAYKTELRLLFQNLIGNALKYSKPGVAPIIKVSSYKDGNACIFSIADNGIGIPEENLDSIFTIFSRVPTENKYEGTGVGLAHCEKIVKLHEGKIWVDSQLGYGSTFYIKLKVED